MNIGITLMIVGMVTVFIVLLIIINLSKLLIQIVNKVAPEEVQVARSTAHGSSPSPAAPAIAPDVMEVIRQTVAQVTGGKGAVANVVKL